jgi:hypothetical protein
MEGSQIGLEPRSEGCFLDALVQLEKMRMTGADTDPKNVWRALGRKLSQACNRKEECLPGECTEISIECLTGLVRNVAEKTESEVHLRGLEPADAAHFWIQVCEKFRNDWQKLDTDEKAFGTHSRRLSSEPERETSPSGLPGGGKTVLTSFIIFPAMLGKSAFPRIVRRAVSGIVSEGAPRRQAKMI